ncbi:MAG: hypothetical protein METHP_00071 [Methanoregula sp. SKADARSKE-2]|nr:MAG: hypothetical protein METHP_00071 [Methanoregula sp. SKADARSKE-2]
MHPDTILLFVYNLDKGSLSDIWDRQYSQGHARTPPCNLCALIQSPVGMKKSWKRFISVLGIPAEYLYREEFGEQSAHAPFASPGIFLKLGGSSILLAGADEINGCRTTDDLISLVRQRVQRYHP